jgi:hypothetical protein
VAQNIALSPHLILDRMVVSLELIIHNTLASRLILIVELFKPLGQFLELSQSRRSCAVFPDELWLEAGIREADFFPLKR